MDAAHKLLLKTTLFLTTALLLAVPGRAQQLIVSSTTVGLNDNQAQSIQVTASGTASLPYSISGKPFWLNVFSSSAFTTPDILSFQLANTNCGTCTATIVLTAATGTPVSVTVTYAPGGGGSNGTLIANPSSLTFSAAAGTSAANQTITISTTSPSPINIVGLSNDQPTWLTQNVTSGSFSVSSSSPATLTVGANAFSLANGTYTGHITITPSTGTATVVTVTFNVGAGSSTGTIVATPGSLAFSAASGQIAAQQNVSLTTASATGIPVFISPDVTWLQASVIAGNFTISSSAPATLAVVANAASLSNGIYTGHITITPNVSGGTPTVITVTFTVGTGSTTGTIVATPASLAFTALPGSSATAQNVSLTTTSASTITFTAGVDVAWLNIALAAGNVASVSSLSPSALSVTASAFSLTNGTYTGHITITPSSGTATVITVTFTVGTGGGGGSGTITASQSSLQFSYPPNPAPIQLTIGTTNASVTRFNVNITSQSNWLLFGGVMGNFTQIAFNTFPISVDPTVAATLPTGTYTGTITLTNPNNLSDTTVINATLSVNGGGPGGGNSTLSVSPPLLTFTASPGGTSQSQNLTITVPGNAPIQLQVTSFNGAFFNLFSTSTPACSGTPSATPVVCTLTGSQTLTFTVNPGSLTVPGKYSGSIQITSGGTTQTIFLALNLVNPVTTLTTDQSSLAFSAAAGSAAQTKALVVTVPGSAFVQATVSSSNGNFFSVSSANCNATPGSNTTCAFSGNQTLYVTINPASLTSAGTYSGNIALQSNGVSVNVPVTLTLTPSTGGGNTAAIAAPASLAFAYQSISNTLVPQQIITVGAAGAFTATAAVQTTQQWLIVSPPSGTGPGYLTVSVSPQGLTAGTYQGSITINSTAGTLVIPVTLTVTANVVIEASPGVVFFSYNSGSPAVQQSILLFASDNSATPVSASSSTSWITVGPGSSTTTPASFTLTLNPSGLCNGLNVGSVTITASNALNNGFTVPVVANVSGSTATGCTGGNTSSLTVTPASLTFSATPGGSTPATQNLAVTSTSGATGVTFTYQVTGNVPLTATVNGTTLANGQLLTTPATLAIGVNATGLTPGATYSGNITLTPAGGTPVTVPVTLTIANQPTVTASPTNLTFSYNAGSSLPSAQTVQVTGGTGLTFTATASSSGNWLAVSPTSGTTPGSLSVSVNPAGLTAGSYTGTITVAGTGSATGTTTINVTLTVTAPLPTITSVGSAASYLGGSISPGEIITIFGMSIGPTPGVQLTLDPATGKVATTLGGTQVLVNGFLSPMIFASNGQVSAVVPYEICASSCGPGTIASVVVKFLGQTSNGITTPVASTTTAIFTANASGSGPGAILNANLSVNSPGNPANKGDIVAIYMTGEGQTSPAGVTGKVTTVSPTGPVTPVPLLPVAVLIDGQPASISFAGEAPGLVSGVMQLNVQIPPGARSGNLPLIVSIGGVSSQAGVTVSVR